MKKPASIMASMTETAASSAVLLVLNLVSGVLLARTLGPEARGVYGAFLFWTQITILLGHLSLFDAFVIRARSRESNPIQSLPVLLLLGLLIATIYVILFIIGTSLDFISIEGISQASLITLFAIFIFIGFSHVSIGSVERAQLSFHHINIERILTPSLFMIFMLVFFWINVQNVVTLLFAFALAKSITLLFRAWRFRHNFIGHLNFSTVFEMLVLGPRLHLATGLLILSSQADRLFVVALWPSDQIGYYFVAYSAVGAGMSLASQAIQMTLLPHLAGLDSGPRRNAIERMFRGSLLFGLGVAIPVWFISPWLIPLLYGPEFSAAVPIVQGITFGMMLQPCLWGINVANRALELSRPGIEMGLISLGVYSTGYAITGFSSPSWLFAAMFLANVASISRGILSLSKQGAIRIGPPLVPNLDDIKYVSNGILQRIRKK